ncbi:unnamed protein product, partial [Symbiodinium sp. CCMP2456]
ELSMGLCTKVPAEAWRELQGAEWPKLAKANFYACFETSGDGAAALLSALARCRDLQDVHFTSCGAIPSSAWQQLSDGTWPRLRRAGGIPAEQQERLRRSLDGGGADAAAGLHDVNVGTLALCPKTATVANFFGSDEELRRELAALARCRDLQ